MQGMYNLSDTISIRPGYSQMAIALIPYSN
jgi:hypothetical protein